MAAATTMKTTVTMLLAAGLLSGCGTVSNQMNPTNCCEPYGGVKDDFKTMGLRGGSSYFLLLDVPVSAVGDTLLLPFDLFVK